MSEASWQQKLRANARKTAQFWVEDGQEIAHTPERGNMGAQVLTLTVTAAALGVASQFAVSEAAQMFDWHGKVEAAASLAGIMGSMGIGGYLADRVREAGDMPVSGATEDPLANPETQRRLQESVKELFQEMEKDPNARAEIVSLLKTEQGRDLFLNTMETQPLDQAASRLLDVSQADNMPDPQGPDTGPDLSQ